MRPTVPAALRFVRTALHLLAVAAFLGPVSARASAPVIEGVTRVSPGTARPGDTAVFRADLLSGAGGTHDVRIDITDPTGMPLAGGVAFITLPPNTRASVELSVRVPTEALSGTHQLTRAYVADGSLNLSTYQRSGQLTRSEGTTRTEGTHSLLFAPADFTVESGIPFYEPPRLLEVGRASASSLLPGQALVLTARVAWGSTGPGQVRAIVLRPVGASSPMTQQITVDLRYEANGVWRGTREIDGNWPSGNTTLLSFEISDPVGRLASYRRDGSIGTHSLRVLGPATHALDLRALDFRVDGTPATPPINQLVSIRRVTPPPFRALSDVVFEAVVSPGGSTLSRVDLEYTNAAGVRWTVPLRTGVPSASGAVTLTGFLPRLTQPGRHEASAVIVSSDSGALLQYERSGTILRNAEVQSERHSFDFSPLDFVAEAIPVPPRITEFAAGERYVALGAVERLSVRAESPDPLSYQWFKDGVPLHGATAATLDLSPFTDAKAGTYRVAVASLGGSVDSGNVLLRVANPSLTGPPVLSRDPDSGAPLLAIEAVGQPPLTVEWYEGLPGDRSRPVTAATGTTLRASISLVPRWFWARVRNAVGTFDGAATLVPPVAGLVTVQPQAWTTRAGSPALFAFRAAFARAPGPVSVRVWRGGGDVTARFTERARRRLTGMADGILTSDFEFVFEIETALFSDVGDYQFEIEGAGAVPVVLRSAVARLRLGGGSDVPYVATQPVSQRARAGENVTLSVRTSPTTGCAFQWRRDGWPVVGATADRLELRDFAPHLAGRYDVIVSLPTGQMLSGAALVEVVADAAPTILSFPSGSRHVGLGTPVRLEVAAGGSAPLRYQWYKDGAALVGAILPVLEIVAFRPEDAGDYHVVVSGSAGSVTSAPPARLIRGDPAIVRNPVRTYDGAPGGVQLAVEAVGAPPLSYRWFEGTPPDASRPLPGPGGPTIDLPLSVAPRSFWASATNAYGSASSEAVLVPGEALILLAAPADWVTRRGGRALFDFRVGLPRMPQTLGVRVRKGGEDVTARFRETARRAFPGVRHGAATTEIELAYELPAVDTSDEGAYVFEIASDSPGPASLRTPAAALRLAPDDTLPRLLVQPASQRVIPGTPVTLAVVAAPAPDLSYQWRFAGAVLPGATAASLVLPDFQESAAGAYEVVVRSPDGAVVSDTAVLTVDRRAARIANLSVRAPIDGPAAPVILGVGIRGPAEGTLPLLVRAVGPSLLHFGVPNPVANPEVALFDSSGRLVGGNDDWISDLSIGLLFVRVGAFPLTANSGRDAAAAHDAPPGTLTAHLRSRDAARGVVLGEIYDARSETGVLAAASPRLSNLSARLRLGAGESATLGFVVVGPGNLRLLIRAAGPSLTAFGVGQPLADPRLTVRRGNGVTLGANDDWDKPDGASLREAFVRTGAFPFSSGSRDAALLVETAADSVTVAVDRGAGEVLLELYVIE